MVETIPSRSTLTAKCQMLLLPFRLSARQLFHFALFRSASVVARFLGLFRLDLLAGCAFGFLAFFFAQSRCICHECCQNLLEVGTGELCSPGQPRAAVPTSLLDHFQLRVLLHQLFQTEARKLYRNLGFFTFSFALVDGALAIFRVADLRSWAESLLAFGSFDGQLWGRLNFFPREAKNSAMLSMELYFGPVLDARTASPGAPCCGLVFVFVSVVSVASRNLRGFAPPDGAGPRPHTSRPHAGAAASDALIPPAIRAGTSSRNLEGRWLRGGRCRSGGDRPLWSTSAGSWRGSCPRSRGGALPRCHRDEGTCGSAETDLPPGRTEKPEETPGPWRRGASSM